MEVAAAWGLRATRFCCASAVHRSSAARTPVNILLRQAAVVGSELLPIANVDVQVLEGSFDAIFVAFLLPSD